MSNIITNTDVFEFMGTQDDVRTDLGAAITDLITRMQAFIEEKISRYIHSETITDILFQHDLNCEIYENELFLKNIYRDLYSISSITETGTALSAVTEYNDNKDYYLDKVKGVLIRNNQFWSQEPFAIKISGKVGLVNSDDTAKEVWKQALIEIVAAKSGLWKEIISTEGGNIERNKKMSTEMKFFLETYNLRGF